MKHIITFFGADAKVGTTMIAQSFAEVLASKDNKVLYITASSELFDDYIPIEDGKEMGLDYIAGLKPQKDDIDMITNRYNGLSYIRGASQIGQMKRFDPYCLIDLAECVGDEYDYMIIDGGHNYQYPLPCGALLAADMRYYVMESCNRSVDRLKSTMTTVIKAMADTENDRLMYHIQNLNKDEIILNKAEKNRGTFSPEVLKEIFGMKINQVPVVANSITAETNRKTLLSSSRGFNQSIQNLVDEMRSGADD